MSDLLHYRRVRITGVLRLESELHIGSGGVCFYKGKQNPDTGKPEQYEANAIALDAQGKPYIPGSSLRGLLASLVPAGSPQYRRWFGDPRGQNDDHGAMGALRVYDAVLEDVAETHFMSRTAIDSVTGTAKQHQLATHVRVGSGAQFKVEIGFDTRPEGFDTPVAGVELINEADIESLLTVLQGLNGEQIGTGKSVGQGLLEWRLLEVNALSDKDLVSWIQNNLRHGKAKKGKQAKLNKYQKLQPQFKPVSVQVEQVLQGCWREEAFKLKLNGSILINNPHDPEVKAKNNPDTPKEERKKLSDLVFLKDQRQSLALIPGSTLKGWFRGHCRRILMTLIQDAEAGGIEKPAEDKVDLALNEVFGGPDSGYGVLRFRDATLRFSEADQYRQTFNAVDRFTGGVKDTALYKVTGLRTDKVFSGSVAYRRNALKQTENGWMNLLLMFAWRDAEEGDLVLGWGKSRGYGRLTLEPDDGGWSAWLNKLDEKQLDAWEQQLWQKLGIAMEATA
ncbi:MAG: hypothetical protein KDI15_13325 [Thiothrix sp.]|nr:hypothetical protein [Thiothrix sp.]HPE60231.1 RAMP superfamily CRISPR-associated protein [Thiolinea sp.]